MTKLLRCVPVIFLAILTACGSGGGSSSMNNGSTTPPGATLKSIQVTSSSSSVPAGLTVQFTATGKYSDNSTQNLTTLVSWSSSNSSVLTIAGGGVATTNLRGACVVTATLGSVSDTLNFSVNAAVLQSLAVNPKNVSVPAGSMQQFHAMGTYSDNSVQDLTNTATWNSASPSVAVIASPGVANGKAQGTAAISASVGTVSDSGNLNVGSASLTSISVTPATPSVASGVTQQFKATGTYSDSTTQDITGAVTWNSSNSTVATIAANGLATSQLPGASTVSATSGTVSGSTLLTVTPILVSIAITAPFSAVEPNTNQQFTATGTYNDGSTKDITRSVTWASSDTTKATISSTQGFAHALATGTTIISATSGSVPPALFTLTINNGTLTSIAITPNSPAIPLYVVQQFTATGTYSDGATQDITNSVSWSSSTTGVATITVSGVVTGRSVGSTTIRAASGAIHQTLTLNVTAANILSLTIQPGNVTIAQTTSTRFTAIGLFSDGSTRDVTSQVTWTPSPSTGLTPTVPGGFRGVTVGLYSITASLGSANGSVNLNVTSATLTSISVSPSVTTIAPGTQTTFVATGSFNDGTTQVISTDVAWSSSDPTIATVGNIIGSKGIASAITLRPERNH